MNIPVCLNPGCYVFIIYDSNGDGMSVGGSADFQLTGPGGTPTYASLSDVNFGNEEDHNFCIQGSGIQETSLLQFRVSPNPSNAVFNLYFDNAETRSIKVLDALGRIVFESSSSAQSLDLNLSNESKGVYILQVETKGFSGVKKLVIN